MGTELELWCRGWDLNSHLLAICTSEVKSGDVQLSYLYAATSPFFFLGASSCSGASLAGSEKVDKKMPYVWRIHFRRAIHGCPQTKNKLSRMRQHKNLERRSTEQKSGQDSALSLSRLRPSVFRTVNDILNSQLCFWLRSSQMEVSS